MKSNDDAKLNEFYPRATQHADRMLSDLYRRISEFGESTCQLHPLNQVVAARLSIPLHAVQMVVALEDKRFWLHPGFDPIGIARAIFMTLAARGRRQGASSIPEQLAKLRASRNEPSTLAGRAHRLATGAYLVMHNDRVELLTEYLMRVYLGSSSFGIQRAAQHYFNRRAETLTPAESFFLAERIALPNTWRERRMVNILARSSIRALLGEWIYDLPSTYGSAFGQAAYERTKMITNSISVP